VSVDDWRALIPNHIMDECDEISRAISAIEESMKWIDHSRDRYRHQKSIIEKQNRLDMLQAPYRPVSKSKVSKGLSYLHEAREEAKSDAIKRAISQLNG